MSRNTRTTTKSTMSLQRRKNVACRLGWVLVCSFPLLGCQQWPGTMQAKQFQQDSDRLLNEFKAEKQRADELAAKNQLLEQRLAETEKQFALQNLAGSRNRSGLPNTDTKLSIGTPSSGRQLSQSNTSRSTYPSGTLNQITGPGLPDARPGTGSRLTSTGNPANSGQSLLPNGNRVNEEMRGSRQNAGTSAYAPQWRPIQKQ